MVITGEGRCDATSFDGKVVGCVMQHAARRGVLPSRDRRSGNCWRGTDCGRARRARLITLNDLTDRSEGALVMSEELIEQAAFALGSSTAARCR